MDSKFSDKLLQELQAMIEDIEAGHSARNPNLYSAVARCVREQNPDL